MVARLTNISEEARAFLQKRIALFGRIIFVINVLGLALESVNSYLHFGAAAKPFLVLLFLSTLVTAAVWLLARSGTRSARYLRVLEAVGLAAYTLIILAAGRYIIVMIVPMITEGTGLDAGTGIEFDRLVGVAQILVSTSLAFILTYSFVVRAAIVPSPPLYTALLTAAAGIPLAIVPTTGVPFCGAPEHLIRAHTPELIKASLWASTSGWWMFTVLVCVAISKVIYGLHEEVRQAKRLGQYTLEQKLGEGGMGVVYRARHAMMRRPTAVKLLLPERSGESSLARFEREVQLTARLTHPNTVTVFDFGRTPDGVFYYAMELLDGASLQAVVDHDGPQPPGRILKVLIEVTGALEEAHGISLIHRDIKPENIILCRQGGKLDVSKLLDFGLVKEMSAASSGDVSLTQEGTVTGTPLYMAPENLTAPDTVDGRADLYSVGAVGYYLLTGSHVFKGNSMVEVCSHHLHSIPIPPTDRLGEKVPEDLEQLILCCLEKDREKRPQSAAELLERLMTCESFGTWTAADADAWWKKHGKAVRPQVAGSTTPGTRTIAVDLDRRRSR